jgi:hypothetical protein
MLSAARSGIGEEVHVPMKYRLGVVGLLMTVASIIGIYPKW